MANVHNCERFYLTRTCYSDFIQTLSVLCDEASKKYKLIIILFYFLFLYSSLLVPFHAVLNLLDTTSEFCTSTAFVTLKDNILDGIFRQKHLSLYKNFKFLASVGH
jgi:hypothetical protein